MTEIGAETFLITGATGGIGSAISKALHKRGAKLLIQGRSISKLEKLKAQLAGSSGKVVTLAGDLTQAGDIEQIVQAALAEGVTGVVNSAGVNEFCWFEKTNIEKIIGLNVTATLQLTQALLPSFKVANHGCIVSIGSTFGAIGYPGYVAYCAGKYAIAGFSEALKRELADTNVEVIYVSPRATSTDMNGQKVVAMNTQLGVTEDVPEVVAEAVVESIAKSRSRFQLGGAERVQSKLNKLLPGIVDKAIAKQLPVIKQYLSS